MHVELEECVADFVGKPAAIVFGMGYVTNSAILPVLIGKVLRISWLNQLWYCVVMYNPQAPHFRPFSGRSDH